MVEWKYRTSSQSFYNTLSSFDGVDCRIREPIPFSCNWHSYKFSGPGVRYEVAVSIKKPNIVWVNGAFPCGTYPDLRIFRKALKQKLLLDKLIVADGDYSDVKCFLAQNISVNRRSIF